MRTPTATSVKLDTKTKNRIQRLAEARRRKPHYHDGKQIMILAILRHGREAGY